MNIDVNCQYEFVSELRRSADLHGVPLYSETITADIVELIEEVYTRAVLSETLPLEIDTLAADIQPIWQSEPLVAGIRVTLSVRGNGAEITSSDDFARGRWVRTAKTVAVKLCAGGHLSRRAGRASPAAGAEAAQSTGVADSTAPAPVVYRSVTRRLRRAQLGAGGLVAERPVLVNQRLVADAIRCCEQAGTAETGGAVLGKIIRLSSPLPGTTTRLVTLLTSIVEDPRHLGAPLSFTFSLEGLAEAAIYGELRGFHETVETVFHTHGWQTSCGNCNQNAQLPAARMRSQFAGLPTARIPVLQ